VVVWVHLNLRFGAKPSFLRQITISTKFRHPPPACQALSYDFRNTQSGTPSMHTQDQAVAAADALTLLLSQQHGIAGEFLAQDKNKKTVGTNLRSSL